MEHDQYKPSIRLSMRERFRRLSKRQRKPLKILVAILAGMVLVFTVAVSALYRTAVAGLPDVSKIDVYDPTQTTKIFASDGTLIATLFDENRTYAKLDQIAPVMREAIVAIEDRRFYDHGGVDWKGIARAAIGNVTGGGVEQGASTLTMQLARRLFLDDERTYSRKLREAMLADRIERKLPKDKILELYLNEVYFGAGAYGIDSAAALYFGKNPDKLSLWEACLLAGLVQAPSAYSPLVSKTAAIKRMEEVLAAMSGQGKATAPEVLEAVKKASAYRFVDRPLGSSDGMLKFPYFSTYVIRQLSEQFPENYVRRGGLKVVTTLDVKLQAQAEKTLRETLEGRGRDLGADAGAVVVLDNITGDILALVGGPGWNQKKQFNAAWQARRQPGSAFKMFVYAAALEAGYSPEQEFADTKAVFSPSSPSEWIPKNSDSLFMGAIPMRTGLQFSRNLVSAKLIAHVGPARVVSLAHRMGIDAELPEYASLALGAGEVTPLQMARAYSAIPSGGFLRPTLAIKSVSTSDGTIVRDFTKESRQMDRVLSKDTARVLTEMLHRVVTGGTAGPANLPNTYVAGKTGTTDNFKDAWFVGFTPHQTISVWMGRNDNKPMERLYGGTLPAEIFHQVALAGLKGKDPAAQLPGVAFGAPKTLALCWDSTYLATSSCPKRYNEVFKAGVVPTRQCPIHRMIRVPMPARLSNLAVQPVPSGAATPGAYPTASQPRTAVRIAPSALSFNENDIPANLNPRNDPEVVTPEGSLIPYTEIKPSLKLVKLIVEGASTVLTAPTPGSTVSPDTDEVLVPADAAAGAPLTNVPAPENDPALSGVSAAPRPSNARAPSGAITEEPSYPKAGAGDPRDGGEEVIYESGVAAPGNEEPTIPADPIAR